MVFAQLSSKSSQALQNSTTLSCPHFVKHDNYVRSCGVKASAKSKDDEQLERQGSQWQWSARKWVRR